MENQSPSPSGGATSIAHRAMPAPVTSIPKLPNTARSHAHSVVKTHNIVRTHHNVYRVPNVIRIADVVKAQEEGISPGPVKPRLHFLREVVYFL